MPVLAMLFNESALSSREVSRTTGGWPKAAIVAPKAGPKVGIVTSNVAITTGMLGMVFVLSVRYAPGHTVLCSGAMMITAVTSRALN